MKADIDGNCRLLQSCSEFRIADNNMRNAIGIANKFLHRNDIKYFKQNKYGTYDWGCEIVHKSKWYR